MAKHWWSHNKKKVWHTYPFSLIECSCLGESGCGSTPASNAAASSSSHGGAIRISEGWPPGLVKRDVGSTKIWE